MIAFRARTARLWLRLLLGVIVLWALPAPTFARGSCDQPGGPPGGRLRYLVFVSSHGWHTGIILRRSDLRPADGWPALPEFGRDEFLEFGWGSEPFYTAPRPTLAIALRTVFTATPSVLHVVGFRGSPVAALPYSEVVAVPVSRTGWHVLAAEIDRTFARDGRSQAQDRGPGLYGHSRFFAARGRYSLAHNCNGWTATMLRAGGLPVRAGLSTLTAGGLMTQVRPLGDQSYRPVPRP